jgi:SRSO17 transposase
MTEEELEQWQDEFEAFHARFADLFERSESREQARKYLRGLLTEAERKNSWQMAEAVGERTRWGWHGNTRGRRASGRTARWRRS